MKAAENKSVWNSVNEFIEMFDLPQWLKNHYSYDLMQKKLLAQAIGFYLQGGDPMQGSGQYPKLGNLTNDDIGVLAMWKQDPHGMNIDDVVQKATIEFGQYVAELNRGVGETQYSNITDKISAGQRIFNLSKTQSFSRDYSTAAEFASHGGGSMHDLHHGEGGVITLVNTKRKPMFFLDEFNFYSSLAEMYFRKIIRSADMQEVIDSIDFDDLFEAAVFEDEWLVPTVCKFKFVEAVNGGCKNKDLVFEIL